MVNLLVSSNIQRCAEFKAITRILTIIDDNLVKFPVSKRDIFNCKDVSVIEKQMLMKFMCVDHSHCHKYSSYYSRPNVFL